MEQNIRRQGLLNAFLLLVLGVGTAVVANYAHSATGWVSATYLALGFLVGAISYLQMRLEEREQLEQMEYDELKKATAGTALFAGEADTFPARRARQQFERFFVPGFSIALFIAEGFAVYFLWRYLAKDQPSSTEQGMVAMALNGIFALIFFQFGKYSAVLARLESQRLLRPSASYLLLGAMLTFFTALVEVAGWAGYPVADVIVGRILVVFLALVALEGLITLLLEIYRPRLKGQIPHPLYESRLIGLLGQPGGLIRTAAQALDYQFGFKVSETWFYRFLERALAWLILVQVGVLLISSMFVIIDPGQQGLLERFGHLVPGRPILGPGLHLKWPWPIDAVYRYNTARVHSFEVGLVENKASRAARLLLWTQPHAEKEYNMLVASASAVGNGVPVNFLAVSIPVQYKINNLLEFAYTNRDAPALLQDLANREVVRYLLHVGMNDVMTVGRHRAAVTLQRRIQAQANTNHLGVQILFVGLEGVHPPVKIAPEFEKVIGAFENAEATNNYALAYQAEVVPKARGNAAKIVAEAEAYRMLQKTIAGANAARFTNQLTAFNAAPEVYPVWTYLETLGRAIAHARKYVIVPTNSYDLMQLNLEDKIRPDIMNVMMPTNSTSR